MAEQKAGQAGPMRRSVLVGGTAAVLGTVAAHAQRAPTAPPRSPLLAYIGTYTQHVVHGGVGHGEGIYLVRLDPRTGALSPVKTFSAASPSWLAFDPHQRFLYAINEIDDFGGNAGSVTAYAVDANGELTMLNTVSSMGKGPAHGSVHPSGKFVFAANYGGGNVAVLPVRENGSLGEAVDVQADQGSPGAGRPADGPPGNFSISDHDGPHAHMIAADPSGRFVMVNDLGLDRTFIWKIDLASGKLTASDPPFIPAASAGAGPRHFVFHPNGRHFYNLYEEASELAVYDWNGQTGAMTLKQKLSTLPPGYAGTNFTSEILIAPDGRFIYVANRLHNSIAWFAVQNDGRVRWVGEEWTRGDYPRNIAIDPSGLWMFACNQRSDNIAAFRVNRSNGSLAFANHYIPVGSPSVIVFR
jgi:6-phosphogluconolactonase